MMAVRSSRITGVALALAVGFGCLLTAGGSMTTTDAVIAYDVTRGIVERGSIALSSEAPGYDAYRGTDGRYYSPFGIAQSIWNIPFYVAGRQAAKRIGGSAAASQTIPKAAVALATVPAVACLAWVCFALVTRLGAEPRRAAGITLLLVFATSLWPYSGFGFNQPLTALFLWSAVLACAGGAESPRRFAAAGIFAGLALLTRHEMAAAAALLAVVVLVRGGSARVKSFGAYLAGLIPLAAIWCALNWWRFGNPLESGYLRDTTPGYGSSIVAGGMGLLFSPYASLILYSPIVLLAGWGLVAMWRRDRAAAMLFAALFVGYFLLYASLRNWMAGRSYGPRYLVPFLPALVMPLAFWRPSDRFRQAVAALATISVLVQIPGVLVDYSKVRMAGVAAGETVAQDMRWSAMPLVLNARATVENTVRAARFLSGVEPRPQLTLDRTDLSSSLAVSLDVWWLYLAYLGLIGRFTALLIAVTLAVGCVVFMWIARVTAASPSSSARRRS
jgi:hypothetical protein